VIQSETVGLSAMDGIILERSEGQSLSASGPSTEGFVQWVIPDSDGIGSSDSISGDVVVGVSDVDTRGGEIGGAEVSCGLNG